MASSSYEQGKTVWLVSGPSGPRLQASLLSAHGSFLKKGILAMRASENISTDRKKSNDMHTPTQLWFALLKSSE